MAEARKKKILCVEDDPETAALIAEELVERGYEVSLAGDGREGLAAILKDMPDLVLSDISMPVMSGFEILERLTALAPRFRNMLTAARMIAAPAPSPPSAFNATASSTEEAAALASIPAAFSLSSSSLLERPCSLAISYTRFLLID